MHFTRFQNDRFVKRRMLLTIILAHKNPKQYGFFGSSGGWVCLAPRASVSKVLGYILAYGTAGGYRFARLAA